MISSTTAPRALKERLKKLATPAPPAQLRRRFRRLDADAAATIESALRQHYFARSDSYLESEEGRNDLQDHVHRRLDLFRATVIPWFHSARALDGVEILEIGCGTGSSTVALAEQGSRVVAVDILPGSLAVARERCRLYGLPAEFHEANAIDVSKRLRGRRFDMIIFFAALEHMTHTERLTAMQRTWAMLPPGGLWCVVETPNRLWFHDSHTSHLPFFHWLPDQLAFAYSRFSPRASLADRFDRPSDSAMLDFLRLGRGVSFHEFELAMDRLDRLQVVSSLQIYLRRRSLLRRVLWKLTQDSRYESFLAQLQPGAHPGFFHANLDLILRKS
ncbi:MAG: methyltransferase domain-containing protein [Candidatus Eisenbacteria bacterium]|nr:methyltransferase domain-containing protein [Candidatus Eisenbacteria bacterium]